MSVAWVVAASGLLDGERPVGGRPLSLPEEFVPRNVRRRLSRLILQGIQVTWAAADPETDVPLVFGTANGEIETIAALLPVVIGPDPMVSPTLFHNSVHNAMPGYWAILGRRLAASTTVTAGSATFEMALLEAIGRLDGGAPEVQVTAGDEAIRTASWADPGHCMGDFCGSLRLSARPPRDGLPPLGAIESVTLGPSSEGLSQADSEEIVVLDPKELPGGVPHPCASLHEVLEFLLGPPRAPRLRLRRTLPQGTTCEIVFRRGGAAP